MELSKFMKHKEREVVTLLTLILGGGQGLYIRKSKLVKKSLRATVFRSKSVTYVSVSETACQQLCSAVCLARN